VVSTWRPFFQKDADVFQASNLCCSADLAARVQPAPWRDALRAEVALRPADVVIAATDGLFDALHVFGARGAAVRQFVRQRYLREGCDPGLLAEQLLIMARKTVVACRGRTPAAVDTPLMLEAARCGALAAFPQMPEDDIAVVVSYTLPARLGG